MEPKLLNLERLLDVGGGMENFKDWEHCSGFEEGDSKNQDCELYIEKHIF